MALASRTYLSELSQLAAMRTFVGETCRREWTHPADRAPIEQLLLALQEAGANVIEHAYQGKADQPIILVLETLADQIRVYLYHQGIAFDPTTAPPPNFDGTSEGGYGVYMIEQLTDQVSYFHEADGRSAVRLVKNRSPLAQE